MGLVIASISLILISFLSSKGFRRAPARVRSKTTSPLINPARATGRFSKFLRAVKFFALPFVLALTIFVASPESAYAADTPTGTSMFDCMPGGLDWGCQVIGFLYEDRGLQSSNLFDTTKNSASTDFNPTSIQGALRATMGFFSNAVLIIASLILLYHLIVMVAETAHTGTIGGKETNQLWAPIRLVVAIGLLVPLSSGMNSGQHIIIQIAKWGSGLGSQVWKKFIDTMADHQTFALANSPGIRGDFIHLLKIYTCQEINNYFVDTLYNNGNSTIGNERIVGLDSPSGTVSSGTQTRKFSAGNGYGNEVCGHIIYDYTPDTDATVNRLAVSNMNVFRNYETQIQAKAKEIAKFFVGVGQTKPLRSTEYLDDLIAQFQTDVVNGIVSITRSVGDTKYQEIMQSIQANADTYGWMSAGSWFLALTRAQGKMISSSNTVPQIQEPGPDPLARLGNPAANKAYNDFLKWASDAARGYPTSNAGIHADIEASTESINPPLLQTGAGVIQRTKNAVWFLGSMVPGVGWSIIPGAGLSLKQMFGTDLDKGFKWYSDFISKSPRQAAEYLFQKADEVAAQYGIWQSTGPDDYAKIENQPTPMGNTANPFAELVSLGHRKLQAGIDFWGAAMLFATEAVSGQFFASLVPGVGTSAANLISTIGLGAAALFIFFAILSLMAGVYLAFVIPLMPFMRFFYAIVTWIASVMEAMVCLPFFALAHLNPKGEGATGAKTKYGYIMLLQILVRPALTIFGLIGALLLFYVAVKFLNVMYYQAASGLGRFQTGTVSNPQPNGGVGFVARIVLSIFYVALMYVSANMSFKMIDHLPRRALHWFGDQANEEAYHDEQNTIGSVAGNISSEISGNLANIPTQLGQTGRQIRLR